MKKLSVGVFVLLCVSVAQAADLGMFCWQMAPFDDTLEANVTQVDGAMVFLLESDWNGLDVYKLEGGGTAVGSPSGNLAALTATLHNPTSIYWGGQPLCRLAMAIMVPDLNGTWSMDCSGAPAEVFRQGGTLEVVGCQESTDALVATSKARGMSPLSEGEGMPRKRGRRLAGE